MKFGRRNGNTWYQQKIYRYECYIFGLFLLSFEIETNIKRNMEYFNGNTTQNNEDVLLFKRKVETPRQRFIW